MNTFNELLPQLGLHPKFCAEIAEYHLFKSRNRRLTCFHIVVAILATCNQKVVSFNQLASYLSHQFQVTVSRQAIHKALKSDTFTKFFDEFFCAFIAFKLTGKSLSDDFNRVIIQDSTIIRLPQRLFDNYSGVKNQTKQVANARIQLALDLSNHSLSLFSIDKYSSPDISEAKALQIKKGNLILRDRGYLSVGEIERMHDASAFYIFRYKFKMKYFNINTGDLICLLSLLRKQNWLDMNVRIGSPDGPIVRIVAQPISSALANERRRKAKKENNSMPTKDNLEIMGWTIFITNLFKAKYCFEKILRIYGIRWNIEIVFKALKSELNLENIHNVAPYQLRFIVQAKIMRLLLIYHFIAAINPIYVPEKSNKMTYVSFLKLTVLMTENIGQLIKMWLELLRKKRLSDESAIYLYQYCTYEERNRENASNYMHLHLS